MALTKPNANARYVIPGSSIFRIAPSGALQLQPASESAPLVPPELVPLLLLFARPRSLEEAFLELESDWEVEREELFAVVVGWASMGVLAEAISETPLTPERLSMFRQALRAHDPSRPFPLKSAFPLQRPLLFYPGLGTREVHDPACFPWVRELEAAFHSVQSELLALLHDPAFSVVNPSFTASGQWAAAYLWTFGVEDAKTTARCPVTADLLRAIPGVAEFGTSLFSALAPGTHLAPHFGYTNAKLRCQFPLVVPGGCRLRVGDREIEQHEGKCLIFDDSFLHTAWNAGTAPRYVLIFDFFHPELSQEEVDYLVKLAAEERLAEPYLKQLAAAEPAAWASEA